MGTFYTNSTETLSFMSGHVKDLTSSQPSVRSALMLGLALTILGILGGSKTLQSILFAVDHFFGGASHSVSLPGPTGLPLVGNLYQMKDGHVQILAQWTKKYGPALRISLGEREAVFINNHRSLAQTIVAQGPAFQSRPTFKLFHSDFASSGIWTVGTSPISERLSRTRKALSTQIAPRLLPVYVPSIQPQLKRLVGVVSDVSKGPAFDIAEILHCFGTAMVTGQLVGVALPESLVSHIAHNETNIFRQRTIGCPAHDYIPLVRAYNKVIHSFASKFRLQWGRNEREEHAKEFRRIQQVYINDLLGGVRKRIESGDETPSILGNLMRIVSLKDEEILLASYTGIAAGLNIGYTLTWVLGYLANHPEMQERAYEAIREVYNGGVPDPHDFDRVEYVKALHTEGSRYYVPVRLGFPRQTASEATYNGVTIPVGTLVIMNCYACNRDPVAYDRPEEFIPERWMDGHAGRTDTIVQGADKIGVPHLTYGAGRRVCPGIEMANRGIYATLVLLFHFFKWERGELGEEAKKHVAPPFRTARDCTADMDPLINTATPTEAQAIPWACGMKFTARDPEALAEWLAREE